MAEAAARKPWYHPQGLVTVLPFILIHFACFAAIWTGVSWWSLAICFVLYYVRMFGVTGGYHRYFSHKSYQLGRVTQFLMACLAQSSAQKGVLWWAAHHRHHHKHSDEDVDIHSPKQSGLFYAHVGWVMDPNNDDTDFDRIKDFAKFPELRFIDSMHLLPATALGAACFFFGMWMDTHPFAAWEGLVVGFFWSTVLLWHGTFTINSLTHVWGKRVYPTTDESKNSFILALITCGEGWHNNHHFYQSCAPQGFKWWQIDFTYYVLRMMSWVGLVKGMKMPPEHILALGNEANVPTSDEVMADKKRRRAALQEKQAAAAAPQATEPDGELLAATV